MIVVTGRHHTAARPYYEELELDTPAICCNGTYIYDFHNQQIVREHSVEKAVAKQFYELATDYGMKLVLYTTHAMNVFA